MKPDFSLSWKRVIPRLDDVLRRMQEKTLIGFGMVPYPRIIPSFFLNNYLIYAVKDTADLDVLRSYTKIFCLEEKFPKAAAKIHAASYLLGNYAFQAFLKSRQRPFRLMLHRTTPPIVKKLQELNVEWIGNKPETFQDVWLKADFYELLKKLNLPHLENLRLSREEILTIPFHKLYQRWKQPITARRAYPDTGMEQSSFLIASEQDWENMRQTLSLDEKFTEIQFSPTVEGPSLSLTGCVTHLGVLTSSLQLQFVDVREVLHGHPPTGITLGYDFGFCAWSSLVEDTARQVTEKVGEFLAQKGFQGLFGIDFVYDQKTDNIFATDCLPQFPEDVHLYSLMILTRKTVPPMEFFHLMACLGIKERFDFETINGKLKERSPLAHIFLLQKGVEEMNLRLDSGIYSFNPAQKALTFQRRGAFPWDLKNESEFLMLDSMPRFGEKVIGNVPSIFKLIFPRSIAESSSRVKADVGELISVLSTALRK